MKTTVVNASELGDDWTPAAHMPRLVTELQNVRAGDTIRVRDHRQPERGEGSPRWHTVIVTDVDVTGSTIALGTSKWPIAYVAPRDAIVELVDIRREVTFICNRCYSADRQNVTRMTLTLDAFVNAGLIKAGGLRVLILGDLDPVDQRGLCPEHTDTLLY